MEIWKPIKDYEGLYEVSSLGRVKSLRFNKEKLLKPSNTGKHLNVIISNNKGIKSIKVHQLVAMSFLNHTPCKMKLVVDHINNNQLDNRVENLQIITNRENLSKDKKNKTSKYTGVSWSKQKKKWRVCMSINKKSFHLGFFIDELEAHQAYQNKLKTI